ncbi:hypothetical protein P280DRAFT_523050 [Massarina eburnea CBS 473.64]|uniref:Uncharacterized protein n=1 Tax=Massarina eburnea CBS 473.64 TaxID=1395130 RepID=A0A6A6RK10_9PLEO|nr:hypothetical protein P280DRAFT_523050 [Massarina eburnea CBS 473.64]
MDLTLFELPLNHPKVRSILKRPASTTPFVKALLNRERWAWRLFPKQPRPGTFLHLLFYARHNYAKVAAKEASIGRSWSQEWNEAESNKDGGRGGAFGGGSEVVCYDSKHDVHCGGFEMLNEGVDIDLEAHYTSVRSVNLSFFGTEAPPGAVAQFERQEKEVQQPRIQRSYQMPFYVDTPARTSMFENSVDLNNGQHPFATRLYHSNNSLPFHHAQYDGTQIATHAQMQNAQEWAEIYQYQPTETRRDQRTSELSHRIPSAAPQYGVLGELNVYGFSQPQEMGHYDQRSTFQMPPSQRFQGRYRGEHAIHHPNGVRAQPLRNEKVVRPSRQVQQNQFNIQTAGRRQQQRYGNSGSGNRVDPYAQIW